MEIKIAQKNHIKLYIYILVALILAFLIRQIYVLPDEEITAAYFITIVVLFIGTPMLLPAIPLKEHKVTGTLFLNGNNFIIEHNRKKKSFNVTEVTRAKIKLLGYDGQPWHENMTKLGHRHQMNRLRLTNGLGNYFRFRYKTEKYKLELYLDKENEYNDFKLLLENWTEVNSKIRLKIVR
jgi:hypothetical protein